MATLTADIDEGLLIIGVTDPGTPVKWSLFSIGEEIIQYTGNLSSDTSHWTVTRGMLGTTAASHSAGAAIVPTRRVTFTE